MLKKDFERGFMFPRAAEMRRHERVPLALFGHCALADGAEFPCQTKDLSEGGVALTAPAGGEAGERVTLRLDAIGTLEGRIVRSFDGGFAIALTITPERQAELAAYIQWLYSRSALGLIETPLTPDGNIDEAILGASLKLGADVMRETGNVAGETRARLTRNAQGQSEIDFFYEPGPAAA